MSSVTNSRFKSYSDGEQAESAKITPKCTAIISAHLEIELLGTDSEGLLARSLEVL